MKQLLLVDSAPLLRRSLAEHLAGQGFAVDEADTAEEALARLAAEPRLDLLLAVVPVMGPEGIGLETAAFCLALRQRGFAGPLVVLGAAETERPAVLAAGASACLSKPVRLAALTQKLQVLLREAPADLCRIGPLTFDAQSRLVIDGGGREIRVTEKEAAILAYLHRAGNRVVRREELLGEVWGYAGGADTHTVQTHVYRLRRKLGETVLQTETGGYRLTVEGGGEVEETPSHTKD